MVIYTPHGTGGELRGVEGELRAYRNKAGHSKETPEPMPPIAPCHPMPPDSTDIAPLPSLEGIAMTQLLGARLIVTPYRAIGIGLALEKRLEPVGWHSGMAGPPHGGAGPSNAPAYPPSDFFTKTDRSLRVAGNMPITAHPWGDGWKDIHKVYLRYPSDPLLMLKAL